MPEYLSPGVYVEEIDAGPKPIEGVSTSTAGAVGVTVMGPTQGKPVLVTSFNDFTRKFGGFLKEPDDRIKRKWESKSEGGRWWQFPLSVKGFFDNGGQRLFIKRVFAKNGAKAASIDLGVGVISEIVANAKSTDKVIRVRHTLGLPLGKDGSNQSRTVKIYASGSAVGGAAANGNSSTTFTIDSYGPDGTLVLDKPIGQELVAGRDWVEFIPRRAASAGPPPATLKVLAKAKGDWGGSDDPDSPNSSARGNGLGVRVRPVVGLTLSILSDPVIGGPAAAETTSADVAVGGTELILGLVTTLVEGDVVTINDQNFQVTDDPIQGAPSTITITPALTADAAAGVEVVRAEQGGKPRLMEWLSTGAKANDTTLNLGLKTDFKAGDEIKIGTQTVKIVGPVTQGKGASITLDRSPALNIPLAAGALARRLRPANPIGDNKTVDAIRARNASQLYRGAIVELDNGLAKEVTTVASVSGETIKLNNKLNNAYHEGNRIRVVEAEFSARYIRDGRIEAQETFSNLKLVDDGTLDYLVTAVNENSALVNLEAGAGFGPSSLDAFPSIPSTTPETQWGSLAGGTDALDQLTEDDFIGEDGGGGKRTGIVAMEDIDEISLCLIPGMWSRSIHSALIAHCESLRYRFAIVDPPDGLDIEGIRAFREPYDTKYAALYHPWLVTRDPSAGRDVSVAPSAHLAGLYARVDVERGVHKAPANEVVRNITGFDQDVNKREQDMLNPQNINALRYFPGRGHRVWGARVLTSDAAWKYINVRRLFIFVEASIDAGTQWVVFEPNDETLWSRVRQTITIFLEGLWSNGMLFGAKASDAFFVKCDRATMTQDDIDNGRLVCLVGIAPVKPAEFVIFRIQQKTIEANEG